MTWPSALDQSRKCSVGAGSDGTPVGLSKVGWTRALLRTGEKDSVLGAKLKFWSAGVARGPQ